MKLDDIQIRAIDELAAILRTKGVNFTIKREGNYCNQILIWTSPYTYLSAICQYGSYGFQDGLIEVYNFKDNTTGYLTAFQASEMLMEWLKEYKS